MVVATPLALLSGPVTPLKVTLLSMLFQLPRGRTPATSVPASVEQPGEQSPRPSKLTLTIEPGSPTASLAERLVMLAAVASVTTTENFLPVSETARPFTV